MTKTPEDEEGASGDPLAEKGSPDPGPVEGDLSFSDILGEWIGRATHKEPVVNPAPNVMDAAAVSLFSLFDSLQRSGFSESQSLQLVVEFLRKQ